jgi:hypothetical protein
MIDASTVNMPARSWPAAPALVTPSPAAPTGPTTPAPHPSAPARPTPPPQGAHAVVVPQGDSSAGDQVASLPQADPRLLIVTGQQPERRDIARLHNAEVPAVQRRDLSEPKSCGWQFAQGRLRSSSQQSGSPQIAKGRAVCCMQCCTSGYARSLRTSSLSGKSGGCSCFLISAMSCRDQSAYVRSRSPQSAAIVTHLVTRPHGPLVLHCRQFRGRP